MRRAILVCAALVCLALGAVPAAAGTSPNGYELGPEDVLEISVWKDPELTREVVVRPDGGVSFPLVGDVMAEGRTVDELRAEIKQRLREYIPDAPVTVVLLKVRSPRVYVVGKVSNPGAHVLGQEMTVLQALALSGGATPFRGHGLHQDHPQGRGPAGGAGVQLRRRGRRRGAGQERPA
jgi:polysaccharide export outer membrane protein